MASRSGQQEPEKAEVIEELLDALDTTLDRVKVLYEQYFLGIQKQPPSYLHTDVERKLRDLAQLQIRNTALRYRFVTLQQKFGSYNSYWRRTLRQIENGTYTRNLFKIGRHAVKTGAAVPEEILAAMPKRMRDQVIRDREAALALARRRDHAVPEDEEILTLADEELEIDVDDLDPAAFIRESSVIRRNVLTAVGAHRIDEADADFDVDAYFASIIQDDEPTLDSPIPAGLDVEPPPHGEARSAPPDPRPPLVARTRTGHPRPASISGQPDAAARSSARSSSPQLAVEPNDGSLTATTPIRITGQTKAVSEPSSSAPARTTGQIRAATDPSLAAAPTRVTGQARAVSEPSSTANGSRVTGQTQTATDPSAATAASTGVTGPEPAAETSDSKPGPQGPKIGPVVPPRIPVPAGLGRSNPARARTHPAGPAPAPSQATTPLRVAPGAAAAHAAEPVETLAGPFPRIPSLPQLRPSPPAPPPAPPSQTAAASSVDRPPKLPDERAAPARPAPPPGMTDADVDALHDKYVKARQILGEPAEPDSYGKLLRTIHAQAPRIMEQYKAKAVDFSIVVKDNQVIIRAKPKP